MKNIITLVFILFTFFLLPQTIFAQEYVVQPILLIPSDWNTRATAEIVENQYKPNILQALKEVQSWYALRLNGHTFKYVNRVDVRRLNKDAGDTTYISQTLKGYENNRRSWDVYMKLGGPNELIFYGTDVVENYWIVGSENLVEFGGYVWQGNDQSKQFRVSVMDHSSLLKLSPDRDLIQRSKALGILAHELGHAFDLVQAGKAKWHPCSQSNQDECVGGPPFPSDVEWEQNVMGAWWNYPSNGFTNTPANPVIQKAYLSLFLNPNKVAGPTPTQNSKPILAPKPNSVVPNQQTYIGVITNLETYKEVQSGDSFILIGQGFGSKMGSLEFYSSFLNKLLNDNKFEIQSWSDNQINVKFSNDAVVAYKESYIVSVKNLQGLVLAKSKDTLVIQAQSKQVQNYTVTIDVKTTCGIDRALFSDAEITLSQVNKDKTITLVSALANPTGNTSISYTVNQPKTGDIYEVLVKSGDKVMSLVSSTSSNNLFTISNPNKDLLYSMEFNLPQCSVVNRPQGGLVQDTAEDNRPLRVIVSSSDDFTQRQGDSGEEVTKVEVVENPDEQKEVVWEQSAADEDETTYVRVIENDGDIKDYQADLSDGDYTEVGGIQIIAKAVKKVKQIDLISVGDESNRIVLYNTDTGYQNPEIDLPNDLNLFKIVTLFDDGSEEEDSSFYIEKAQKVFEEPVDSTQVVPEVFVPTDILGSCIWDDKLGRMVVVPINDNPFDCQGQGQVCKEFTNDEGKQDAKCIDPPQEGEQ